MQAIPRSLLVVGLALAATAVDAAVIWKVSGRLYDSLAVAPDDPRFLPYAAPVDVYLTFDPAAPDNNPHPATGAYAGLAHVRALVNGVPVDSVLFPAVGSGGFSPDPAATWLTVYNDAEAAGEFVDGFVVQASDPRSANPPDGSFLARSTFSLSLVDRSVTPGAGPLATDQLPRGPERGAFPADPPLFPQPLPFEMYTYCGATLGSCPTGSRMVLSGYSVSSAYHVAAVVDSITVVPVPAAASLLLGGFGALGAVLRRRRGHGALPARIGTEPRVGR